MQHGCAVRQATSAVVGVVSILIRPSGRMQPALRSTTSVTRPASCFNPHPAFWPDATRALGVYSMAKTHCFNPHPAFWPDATRRRVLPMLPVRVSSFNPHPAFWPDATLVSTRRSGGVVRPLVSILIRPSGRMQPCIKAHGLYPHCTTFQSSSGLLAGCNACYLRGPGRRAPAAVSILIRPEGRMQPMKYCMVMPAAPVSAFQSSSGLLAGCNSEAHAKSGEAISHRFNPHPAFWPDATAE